MRIVVHRVFPIFISIDSIPLSDSFVHSLEVSELGHPQAYLRSQNSAPQFTSSGKGSFRRSVRVASHPKKLGSCLGC